MTRRNWIITAATLLMGIAAINEVGSAAGVAGPWRSLIDPIAGYGRCSKCSCPGFFGSGSKCSRSGCGHHYDSH